MDWSILGTPPVAAPGAHPAPEYIFRPARRSFGCWWGELKGNLLWRLRELREWFD